MKTMPLRRVLKCSLLLVLAGCGTRAVRGAPDRVIADFEGGGFDGWRVEGAAFSAGPATGDEPGQNRRVSGFTGNYYASSFSTEKDGGAGRLLSPAFVIDRDHVNFLLGGGDKPGALAVNLLVDGRAVRTATGGKNLALLPFGWDVRDLRGREARIEIVDREAGIKRWDYIILVDDIRLSDTPVMRDFVETVKITGNYINVPVANTGFRGRLLIEAEGRVVCDTHIRPALGNPDYWAAVPVPGLSGKTASVRITNAPAGIPREYITQTGAAPGARDYAAEKRRPQYHFSAPRGWLNDPNGLVYENGRWHLFYQSDPYNWAGLTKQWGHAVSADLFHWRDEPPALPPRRHARGEPYSGGAVIDRKNRAGFQGGAAPAMVAVFTDTAGRKSRPGPAEAIAYSNDGGSTFEPFSGNPVLEHNGRDPKVFWHPPEQAATQGRGHWVMAVYCRDGGADNIDLYVSDNLKEWEKTDRQEGFYECPELVRVPVVDGRGQKTGESRWVMWGGNGLYKTGGFDGRKFTPDPGGPGQTHFGPVYAPQCWNDAPGGRVVQIHWLRIGHAGEVFNQMMGVPLELALRRRDGGHRLLANPVAELATLRAERHSAGAPAVLRDGEVLALPAAGEGRELDIELEFDAPAKGSATLELGEDSVVYRSPGRLEDIALPPEDGKIHLRVLVDRPSIEVTGNRGVVYLAKKRAGAGDEILPRLRMEGGTLRVGRFEAWRLKNREKRPGMKGS
ncbi:MAG: glycoside hydrolase family 32 protein [Opitutaceae bacterium]|jgi:fructan beta-fructosidase|nr:glycoside hydrolase family 32 protein [Opitutaceae bacterium]